MTEDNRNMFDKVKLNVNYDETCDTLTVEGVSYSGDLFRAWAKGGLKLYEQFEIIERADKVITFRRIRNSTIPL